MLNPSIANAVRDDNTITRCIEISKFNGYSAIEVVNLFPLVSTKQDALASYDGSRDEALNLVHITDTIARMDVVLAFGNIERKDFPRRHAFERVRQLLAGRNVFCIRQNKGGFPKHPSRAANETRLVPYNLAQVH